MKNASICLTPNNFIKDEINMGSIAVPGSVVVSNFTGYQHWSLVTDRICNKGNYMLISATKRNGTVKEEPWDVVTKGSHTYVAHIESSRPVVEILDRARSQIGKWNYAVTDNNCEHFVKWATGLKVSSTQIKAGVAGAAAGAAMIGMASKEPKLWKFLAGSLFIGGIAVAATKPKPAQHTLEKNLQN